MDYRINNEAIISCVIAQILKRGVCEPLRLSLLTSLLMENIAFNNTVLTLTYKEYLPIIVNSIVILEQGGIIITENDSVQLTDKGNDFCQNMINNPLSLRLQKIISKIDNCISETQEYTTDELYLKFKIII